MTSNLKELSDLQKTLKSEQKRVDKDIDEMKKIKADLENKLRRAKEEENNIRLILSKMDPPTTPGNSEMLE